VACFKPLKGYRQPSGQITFKRSLSTGTLAEVPCGQCLGCRLDYSQEWAIRCMHEASLYDDNCFITLTYEDAQVPKDGSLNKSHFQKFMKKLRKSQPNKKIRFYHCGEYGTKFSRPHYHALLFNHDFVDKRLWSYGPGKTRLFRAASLEALWPYGYSTIGSVTKESAAYCARYSIKKIRGPGLDKIDPETGLKPYEAVDPESGQIFTVLPEYATMSTGRKPGEGIGGGWYEKYKGDVFPDDFVVYKGKRCRTPSYYRKLLERTDPTLSEELKATRVAAAAAHKADQTRERLEVREKVKKAQTKTLTRSYEDGT